MVQIIPRSRKDILKEMIGQSLGQGLANFSNQYYANRDLEKVINDSSLDDAPFSERLSALETALRPHGEVGLGLLQRRLGIEQQRQQEQEASILAKAELGQDLSQRDMAKLSSGTQLAYIKAKKEREGKAKQRTNIVSALERNGMDKEEAERWGDLYDAATEGGKTEIIKGVNDQIRRLQTGASEQQNPLAAAPIEDIPGIELEHPNYNFPPESAPENMLPAEINKQKATREKHNLPIYEESVKVLHGLEDEYRDIQRLQQINETEELPQGIDKWNVDWETGEPRATALLTPAAQLYLKTIAGMFGKAKEFFPGRVTNFDLETFKKRFPTLANSREGRRLIAKQLELANRIAYLREETLRSAMEHYGTGADPVHIRKAAETNYRRLKPMLEERLKTLDGLLESEYQKTKPQSAQAVPQGNVKVRSPDGQIGYMPQSNFEEAKKAGYELAE